VTVSFEAPPALLLRPLKLRRRVPERITAYSALDFGMLDQLPLGMRVMFRGCFSGHFVVGVDPFLSDGIEEADGVVEFNAGFHGIYFTAKEFEMNKEIYRHKGELLHLLSVTTYACYTSSLCSGPEFLRERFNFYSNVEPGHLVMETSTIHYRDRDDCRFGRLISKDREPMHTDEEWEAQREEWDNERPTEQKWRIKLLTTGEDYCWTNASFMRIPEGHFKLI
jgi:hypothetical protein